MDRSKWEYKKLGDLCTKLTDGSHNPPKGIDDSDYRMISSQNIFNDRIELSDYRCLSKEDFEVENKRTTLKRGDLLLTIVGAIGRCYVLNGSEGNLTLQRSVAALTPNDNVISRYLMYYFIGNNAKLIEEAHGVAQKGIYLKQLRNFIVPVPTLSDQQRIVAELDCLNEMIAVKQEQLKEFDKLAQSIFYDMFGDPVENEKGWKVIKFKDVCENCDYIRKPITSHNRIAGSIPYYGASGIVDYVKDYLFDGEYLLISEDGANLLARSTPIAFRIKGKTWVNNHAHVLKFKNRCEELYVEYSINLRDISDVVTGCAQPKLTQANLNNISLNYPPLSLQQEFADKISAIEAQKELVKQSIAETQSLFDSRMDYYFN